MAKTAGKTFTLEIDGKPAEPHNGAVPSLRVNGEGGQRRIIRACLENFITVCVFGRSFGKTLTAFFLFWEEFRQFGDTLWPGEKTYEFAYCAPTKANHAIKIYRQWKGLLAPLITWHSDVELTFHIKLASKTAIVDFWGLDEYDSHRGARKHRIVVDEMKDVVAEAISATLMPMTLGRGGKLLLQGTPSRWGRGNAYFRDVFELGRQRKGGYFSLTAPSHDNPFLTVQEINDLKQAALLTGGEKTVREEIYAEWLSDEGAVFNNLREVFVLKVLKSYRWTGYHFVEDDERPNLWISEHVDEGDAYREPDKLVAGIDFGIKDATVLSIFNRRTHKQVALARWAGFDDYTSIIPAIDKVLDMYRWPVVLYDAGGGHGGAAREYLARNYQQGVSGKQWNFKSKVADITRAQMLCSLAGKDGGWYLIDVDWQKSEFEKYEVVTQTKQKVQLARPHFGAPPGLNDDSISAACLAATMLSAPYQVSLKKQPPAPLTHDWYDRYAAMYARMRGKKPAPRKPTSGVLYIPRQR